MNLLITTSTFPSGEDDPVPSFVMEQVIYLKKINPHCHITVHAPHNSYSQTHLVGTPNLFFNETRYHYFFPRRFELLAGRGIMPALKVNKWLYFQIPFFIVFHGISLFGLARKIKPDIIYAHWFTPQAINAAIVSSMLGIPFIFTTHASDVSVLKKFPFSRRLVKWVCGRAYCYTAVSSRTASKLASFYSREEWRSVYEKKLKIMPMGISVFEEKEPVNDRVSLLDRAGLRKNSYGPLIFFIGRLVEKKGVDCIIRAIAEMEKDTRDAMSVIVAGEGPQRKLLQELTAEFGVSDIVKFVGHVSGEYKKSLYKQADIVCIPSVAGSDGDEEGFPVVLMEALYYGKLVVASNLSGAETILDNKTNGFIFEADSVGGLKKAILRAANLSPAERESVSESARTLGQAYTWDKLAPKYYELFKGAMR